MSQLTLPLVTPEIRRPRWPAALTAAARAVLVPGEAGTPALHARTVQERLVALGRLPQDAVSGRFDRRTLDAVARFQADHRLPVDGIPDAKTADLLLG